MTIAELRASENSEVHIVVAMRGLGTAAGGPDVLPAYRIRGRVHRWSWNLSVDPQGRPRPKS